MQQRQGKGMPRKRFRKALDPSSRQLSQMNLEPGQNLVTFTFNTTIWGVQQLHAYLFLYPWNIRLVVSDIDGTITRSDIMGQLLPMVGGDWSQSGVTKLYTSIVGNGYKMMYLSARAIAQASATRDYLANVQQDGESLPQGPVIMSPDGLLPSLYREVIQRKPHEFKIACLQNIRSLFPDDWNPFYAGFGNRETDEISYQAVGVPHGKIFTLNSRGEVTVFNKVAQQSKLHSINDLGDLNKFTNEIFSAINENETASSDGLLVQEQFNDFNFWRTSYCTDIDAELA